jgi:hypothetical protein
MHDLLQLYHAVRTLGTLRAIGLALLAIGFVVLGIALWNETNPALQWAGFSILSIALSAVAYAFISDPLQWINFLVQKILGLGLWILKFLLLSVKLLVVLAIYLFYLFWPLDLIPGDIVTVVGLIDDVLIGIGVAIWAVNSRPAPEVDFTVTRIAPWIRAIAAIALSVGALYWMRGQSL